MKPRRGVSVAVVVLLLALLLVSGTIGAFYYSQYNAQAAASNQYAKDLLAADSKYNQTAANYNALLSQYDLSLSLLSKAVALLNTSSPVYQTASIQLASLWRTYLSLKPASSALYTADVLFDYDNGTRAWYNGTSVQPGWNFYILTLVMTSGKLDAQWYPQYGEHFVSGINGVENMPSLNEGWILWTWNSTAKWSSPPLGADDLNVYNGSVFAWTYCKYDPSTGVPLCTPP